MFNVVLFGPPGAGKGTQAELMVSEWGFQHISTGEVFREEIARRSPLGVTAEEYIREGKLVPDHLVIGLIEEYMKNHSSRVGHIFDGFPRTTAQAEAFDEILQKHDQTVNLMLSLDVPDEMLVERIAFRSQLSGRADDTDPNVIRNRIDVYKAQTAIVAEYYAARNKFILIDGRGTIEQTAAKIRNCIAELRIEN